MSCVELSLKKKQRQKRYLPTTTSPFAAKWQWECGIFQGRRNNGKIVSIIQLSELRRLLWSVLRSRAPVCMCGEVCANRPHLRQDRHSRGNYTRRTERDLRPRPRLSSCSVTRTWCLQLESGSGERVAQWWGDEERITLDLDRVVQFCAGSDFSHRGVRQVGASLFNKIRRKKSLSSQEVISGETCHTLEATTERVERVSSRRWQKNKIRRGFEEWVDINLHLVKRACCEACEEWTHERNESTVFPKVWRRSAALSCSAVAFILELEGIRWSRSNLVWTKFLFYFRWSIWSLIFAK